VAFAKHVAKRNAHIMFARPVVQNNKPKYVADMAQVCAFLHF